MNNCRKSFEEWWIKEHGWNLSIHGNPFSFQTNGQYTGSSLQQSWNDWQAAWNSQAAQAEVSEPWELLAEVHTIAVMNDGCLPGQTMKKMKEALESYPDYKHVEVSRWVAVTEKLPEPHNPLA